MERQAEVVPGHDEYWQYLSRCVNKKCWELHIRRDEGFEKEHIDGLHKNDTIWSET